MRDWYETLEAREQLFVVAGAVIVGVALVYILLWTPFDKRHAEIAASVDNFERSLAELRPLRAMVTSGNTGRPAAGGDGQAPIILVSQTLRSRGLERYNRGSRPTPGNGIKVDFDEVAFDELVLWLGDLSDNHGMHVQAGSLSHGVQVGDGRINASLTLERSL